MIGMADWGCAMDGGDGRRGCGGMVDCGWDAVVEKRGKRLGGGDGVEWVAEWWWWMGKKESVRVDEEVEGECGCDWWCDWW